MAQTKINISVNGHSLTATLEDNNATKALVTLLAKGAVTVDAHEFGGFELVGELPTSLPRRDKQMTTKPGDILLYLGNNICFYYGVNSWSFTRLGTVDNAHSLDLKSIYGASAGSAKFVLSLAENSGLSSISASGKPAIVAIHNINGQKIAHNNPELLEKGTYIITERYDGGDEYKTKKVVK